MAKRVLPVQQLTILAICRFAEPISLTSIFPYLPEMIESFGVAKPDIAFWAGMASALYSLCQCVTAIPWVRMSDRYGRKPIILLGLFNTMLTSLLWGFSTTLPMALGARALSGAGNGNVGIIRTMVAELCPWKELQPRAFSIMPLVYSIGSVLGPAIGGALSNPLRRKPGEPPSNNLLSIFPYALPNILAASFFMIGITVGILYMKETLASRKNQPDYGRIAGRKLKYSVIRQVQRIRNVWLRARGSETRPLLSKRRHHSSTAYTDEERAALHSQKNKSAAAPEPPPGYREVLSSQTVLNLLAYTLLAMHSIAYDQLLPVFMHHPVQDLSSPTVSLPFKFASGFGIDSRAIGLLFTLYGTLCIIFQFAVFPPAAQRYGVLPCLRVVACAFPVVYVFSPFAALMPSTRGREAVLFALWMVKGLGVTFAFPCTTILLTNTAGSLRVLGTINGIATAISAVGRAAGPSLGGYVFTAGVKRGYVIAPFWVLALVGGLAAASTFFLVEEEGFGDDSGPPTPKGEYSDGESGQEEGEDGCNDDDDDHKADESNVVSKEGSVCDTEAEDHDPAPLGDVLSRVTSRSSALYGSSVAAESESEEEGESSAPGMRDDRRRRYERREGRPSGSAMQHRRPRRRSSVPVGMGEGFRRMSSNLGQSRSGYGTGGSLAG